MADCQSGCLDQNQNSVSCGDPTCSYGPCDEGCSQTSTLASGACLDENEQPILCGDPSCTYGDCITIGATSTQTKSAQMTGQNAVASSSANGASALTSAIASLGAIAATTYASTQTPQSTIKLGPAGQINVPTGSTTLIIIAVVAIVGFLAFRPKG